MTENEAKTILETEIVHHPEYSIFSEALSISIQALEEVQQYRQVGTVEECRTAREKQISKIPAFGYNLSDTLSVFHCECGSTIKVSHDIGMMNNNNAPNYCSQCGQKLDWSDEE